MKSFLLPFLLIIKCCLLFSDCVSSSEANKPNLTQVAIEAYEYGYPLLMEATTELAFLLSNPNASTNQFLHRRHFPATNDKSVVRPNQDTLYSTAFLDLSKGPVVLSIPATKPDQFYLIQMMDAWTNVFANPGSRTTGHEAQKYLIVGPKGFENQVDQKEEKYNKVLRSPTNLVWIIGRTLVKNDNFQQVWAIQDQYQLSSPTAKHPEAGAVVASSSSSTTEESITRYLLASLGEHQVRDLGGIDAASQMLAPFSKTLATSSQGKTVPEMVEQLTGMQYFPVLSVLMCRNPALLPQDAQALAKFRTIGLDPCRVFKPPTGAIKAIQEAPITVYQSFRSTGSMGDVYNGWRVMVTGLGRYGTQYRLRAAIAYAAIGANLPEDAVYPDTCFSEDGNQLKGEKSYSITFRADALPPVQAFWSVTMYDTSWYFIENPSAPIQRNKLSSVSSQPPLKYESDGSLRLLFQSSAPSDASMSANWIPTMAGVPFCLTLRLYAPEESILNLNWLPPAVTTNATPAL